MWISLHRGCARYIHSSYFRGGHSIWIKQVFFRSCDDDESNAHTKTHTLTSAQKLSLKCATWPPNQRSNQSFTKNISRIFLYDVFCSLNKHLFHWTSSFSSIKSPFCTETAAEVRAKKPFCVENERKIRNNFSDLPSLCEKIYRPTEATEKSTNVSRIYLKKAAKWDINCSFLSLLPMRLSFPMHERGDWAFLITLRKGRRSLAKIERNVRE